MGRECAATEKNLENLVVLTKESGIITTLTSKYCRKD